MKRVTLVKCLTLCTLWLTPAISDAQPAQPAQTAQPAHNPILHTDVPDVAIIRVGDVYYMSSTTMYFTPGLPIMKSTDLVNWKIVSYAYDTLGDSERLTLANGKSDYGRGSWASSLRFHNGTYYASTFSLSTGKTYIFTTKDIEKGPWQRTVLDKAYHDHSLVFDDDGRTYLIYGGGTVRIIELTADATGIKPGGVDQVLIQDPSSVAGPNMGLKAEGSQLIKRDGYYYLFNICWPRGGMRTVIVHRAKTILGPWEGRVALQDKGVAQGTLVDTPDGRWYACLFQDSGSVGRIPWLVPTTWQDGWPVIGRDGKAPQALEDLPANGSLIPGIVASDEFNRESGDGSLPLVWQWNHNPVPNLFSFAARPGHLRLSTDRIDEGLFSARNTLTQRTFGPSSSATVALDTAGLKAGDLAGLTLLQKRYGLIGVKVDGDAKRIVMATSENSAPVEVASVPLSTSTVYLKAECDFRKRADTGRFFYSTDNSTWTPLGSPLKMTYSLAHFTGYRFGLFCYSTATPGGHADFDFFRVSDVISAP